MLIILPDRTTRSRKGDHETVEQVLLDLGINPLEVIVERDGCIVPDDAITGGDDTLRIIRIAHGG